MIGQIYVKNFSAPPVSTKEILRYAGCKEAGEDILTLIKECMPEAERVLSYKVCYGEFGLSVSDEVCDFGAFSVASSDLSKNLEGCDRVLIFAATVGVGLDRLIAKYSRISPSRALLFQAIGAERIEALCDLFCKESGLKLKPRFSPGYGDLPLCTQKEIFAVLSPEKRIGLTVNDSMLMSPTKSVTAIVGISEE